VEIFPYYDCNGHHFDNKFEAFIYANQNNTSINFRLYEKAFDSANWNVDPKLSWDQLLDIRAQQIYSKGKPLILFFSGGWDSYTILEVFERNNIPLDYICLNIKNDEKESILFQNTIALFKSQPDRFKNTKIIIANTDEKMIETFYDSEEWIWKKSARINFTQGFTDSLTLEDNHYFDSTVPDDHIAIFGYDKPRIHIKGTSMYSYQEDTTFQGTVKNPRNIYFFITPELPELHIKQSYILAKYIKHLSMINNKPLSYYNNINNGLIINYSDYSQYGCGRFADYGNSHIQKIRNRKQYLYIPDNNINNAKYIGRYDSMFNHELSKQSRAIRNYLNGIIQLKTDSLTKNIFRITDDNNYLSVFDFKSKMYKLNISS